MNRAVVLLVSGGLWAFMMAALVRREILPFLEYQSPPNYRTMFRDRRQPELERRHIFLGSERRGEVESLFEPLANGSFRTRTRLDLKVQFAERELPMSVRTEVNIDPAFQLSDVTMTADVSGLRIQATGRRRNDKLILSYQAGPFMTGRKEFDFPRDMTLSDSFMPFQGGARMAVGKKWRVQTLDATKSDLAGVFAYASVERKEMKKWRGVDVPAYVVEMRKAATDELAWHTLWVDEQGVVIIEEMTFDKLLYTIVLDEKRALTADEAKGWHWDAAGKGK